MKRILIISENYLPYTNANVNCAVKVVEGLKKRGFSVSVLTVVFDEHFKNYEIVNDVDIYRVKVTEYDKVNKRFFSKDSSNIFSKTLKRIFRRFIYDCIAHLKRLKIKILAHKLKKENFDYVLSIANPAFSHSYAYYSASKKNKWIMYYLDPFVYNCTNESYDKNIQIEKKWCKKAAAVINTEGIKEENEKHSYFPYINMKQLDIPLPNFELNDSTYGKICKNEKIIIRYTGRFYSDIRRPDELLKLIRKLDPEKFCVEFYGESCQYIELNCKDIPDCLKLMGNVSIDRCKTLVDTADILINVGNTCPNQVPSKIFEYISSGKPIINIFLTDRDPSLKYLNKYPRIINTSNGDSITENDILNLLNTPQITEDTLKNIYKDELSDAVIDKIACFILSL